MPGVSLSGIILHMAFLTFNYYITWHCPKPRLLTLILFGMIFSTPDTIPHGREILSFLVFFLVKGVAVWPSLHSIFTNPVRSPIPTNVFPYRD